MKKTTLLLLGLIYLASLSGFLNGQAADENYAQVRIAKFPLAMQCWTYRKYTFYEAIDKTKALGIRYLQAYPGQALAPDQKNISLDHKLNDNQIKAVKEKLAEAGLEVTSYGVVDPAEMGRTEDSMRQVFNFAKKMGIRTIVTEPADGDFPILEKLVIEYGINVAIHNHAVPSKYAKPETVSDAIKGLDDRIGACADTGHWMRSGVRPVDALKLLSGRILDVHFKDLNDFGLGKNVVDVPYGQGKANIHDILAELTRQNYGGTLTIEYENEAEVMTPEPAIRKGLEYIKSITYYENYQQLLKSTWGRYSKHGWNHYGPGHFELDEKTGILKSQGGMGLLWYSVKKFRDFVFEVEFMCAQKETNSGIFLRVPEVPTSDDYIYHSFEVQINDIGQGIHKTAAIYDAEAPSASTSRPTGEWNHMKITCQGKHIQVELNGTRVIDWDAEPRGKVKDLAGEGYIGLQNEGYIGPQNQDSVAPVYFRNIYIKEL